MPETNNKIVDLVITVTLQKNPVFNVQAGDSVTQPGLLPFGCNGFGQLNADLLKQILGKIIAAYPSQPISLCINDPQTAGDILLDSACAGGMGGGTVASAMAAAKSLVPAGPKAKKAAPKRASTKKASPKSGRSRKSTKKPT